MLQHSIDLSLHKPQEQKNFVITHNPLPIHSLIKNKNTRREKKFPTYITLTYHYNNKSINNLNQPTGWHQII